MSTAEYQRLMTAEQIHANCANAYYLNKYGINPRPDKTVNDYYRNKFGDEEDLSAEQQAFLLRTFMTSMADDKESTEAIKAEQEDYSRQLTTYLRNRFGDEYADVDELGFEPSYMGLRADHNHIF